MYCKDADCQIRRYCRRHLERTILGYWDDSRSIQDVERMLYLLAMRETTWAGGGLDLVDHIVTRVEGSVEGRQEEDSQSDFDYNSDDDDDNPNPNSKPPGKDRQWFKIRGWFKFR
jgi:hypothetical protein